MGFVKDFKAFALRGNVVDMAVGVIIGGAFGKIVTSLVNDILMPPIGMAIGGMRFRELKVVLKEAVMDGEEVLHEAITLNYGMFIQNIVDFLIIALAIFFMIRVMMRATRKKEEEAPAPEPTPSKEELLLTEIRDLLKAKE